MDKEELEWLVDETIQFRNVDEAFYDYTEDLTAEEIIDLLDDETKEKILLDSPSYVKRKDKIYFNGEFINLEDEEIDEVIDNLKKGDEN